MKLIGYIVQVFVMADDFCKIYYPTRKLRSRGSFPKLADSEVITMELVGEYLEVPQFYSAPNPATVLLRPLHEVCRFVRAKTTRQFKQTATYGRCNLKFCLCT